MNLLKEIEEELKMKGKTLLDIKWVGTKQVYVDLERFLELANTDYDAGYGASEVAVDLIIVGENWWLERHDYDGSEWFEYKELPKKPEKELKLTALTIDQAIKLNYDISCGWETLKRINNVVEEEEE